LTVDATAAGAEKAVFSVACLASGSFSGEDGETGAVSSTMVVSSGCEE
jgi:hypothetical protein